MALPTDLVTLDIADVGRPFVRWSKTDSATLDVAFNGLPFYAQPTTPLSPTLAAGQATITITAPSTIIVPLERRFPGLRDEDQRISQRTSHLFPKFAVQDPALIP